MHQPEAYDSNFAVNIVPISPKSNGFLGFAANILFDKTGNSQLRFVNSPIFGSKTKYGRRSTFRLTYWLWNVMVKMQRLTETAV